MWQYKICLSFFLDICLIYMPDKNWSILTKFGYVWTNDPIYIYRYRYRFVLEKSPFHLGTIINFVAMWQYKICLSFCQNICLIYKSCKNWSIRIKLGHFLAVSNLSLYKKNCGCMVDTFYRYSSKSCIVVLMYVPLSICLCDNNITSRTSSVMGFLQKLF